uniref:NADH-ubiquinone oxidoreductase chain 5 n=1 Tax=Paranemertes cf. peregrina SCS-2010 TaxID=743461 RepID=E7C1A1_9BILA|nr:NADH dehydrogenase subunit 5 [Paranemertes cf. peregrina SCS-2010]ADD62161.1 NADH dehydrogenase subunit 5 [Paranemertes cf. peregrina SCS-2010]
MFFWKSINFSLYSSFLFFFVFFFLFFFLSVLLFNFSCFVIDWQFFSLCGFDLSFSILVDWVSLSFSLVVFSISFSVVWFSFYYMSGDQNVYRFTWLVIFFILSMVFLIFIPNLVSLLIGWDGLGLISFCLVVYYQNFKSLVSGMLTVLMNRVGDVMILLSIGWLISFGSWSFLFLEDFYLGFFVSVCVVLAGMTKSAQFPFCSWLPAAMAAPTPVSALVHSSTLVTAGVFLIIRFWEFINCFLSVVYFLQLMSLLTMVLSGLSALFETDLKKIIALSTLSQLSVMLFAVSFNFSFLGLFHLYTHALFKALLFLCAGCLINSFGHVQDLRHLGACWSLSPCVMVFLNLANLALCGFPFFGGFYSKDMILEVYLWGEMNFFFCFFVFLATSLTVGYSVRLSLFSSFGVLKMNSFFSKTEENLSILYPLLVLGVGALFGGFFFFFFNFSKLNVSFFFQEFMMSCLFFSFSGGVYYWFFFYFKVFFKMEEGLKFKGLLDFGSSMWYLQNLSTQGVLFFPMKFFFHSLYVLDCGYFELLGGKGILSNVSFFSSGLNFISYKSLMFSLIFVFFVVMIIFFF